MQYRATLTIPAGTLEADPAIQKVAVCFGVLKRYVIYFPPGHAGRTYAQVFYRGRQILPTSPGETFSGDDLPIDLPDSYPIEDPPFELELYGWSPDANYDHNVLCLFYIESPQAIPQSVLGAGRVELPVLE